MTTTSYATWMNDNASWLGNNWLNNITLPGTHDSGTYAYQNMSMPPVNEWSALAAMLSLPLTVAGWQLLLTWTITQDRSIAQQLTDGIRYLDIRTQADGNGMYIVHGAMPHSPKVITGSGSGDAKGVIEDIRDFVVGRPRELVVVDFQEFQDMTQDNYTTLFNAIQSELGPYLVGTTLASGPSTYGASFNQIWGNSPTNGQVIVLFDRSDSSLIDATNLWNSNLYWDRSQWIASPWADTDDSNDLRNFLYLGNPQNIVHAGMFAVLQGQLTTITSGNPTGLLSAATNNNPQVMSWITSGKLGTRWNIIILDYYDQGGISYLSTVVSLCENGWPSWAGSSSAFWGGNSTVSKVGSINKTQSIAPKTDRGVTAAALGSKLYVFYRDTDKQMRMTTYDGTFWTDASIAAITEDVDGPPGVTAFNNNGTQTLMLLYRACGHDTLRMVTFDGTDWSAMTKPGLKSSQSPSLAPYTSSEGDAKIMVGYLDDDSSDMKYAQYFISSGSWTDQGKIKNHSSLDPQSDHSPAVVNYNGKLYFFYSGLTFDDLYQMVYDPSDGSWTGNVKISSLPGGIDPASDETPTAVVFSGKIYLAYESASLDDLYLSTYDGTTWSGNTEIEDISGSEIDPATDHQPALVQVGNALYLFYKGVWKGMLYVSANAPFHNWPR